MRGFWIGYFRVFVLESEFGWGKVCYNVEHEILRLRALQRRISLCSTFGPSLRMTEKLLRIKKAALPFWRCSLFDRLC